MVINYSDLNIRSISRKGNETVIDIWLRSNTEGESGLMFIDCNISAHEKIVADYKTYIKNNNRE